MAGSNIKHQQLIDPAIRDRLNGGIGELHIDITGARNELLESILGRGHPVSNIGKAIREIAEQNRDVLELLDDAGIKFNANPELANGAIAEIEAYGLISKITKLANSTTAAPSQIETAQKLRELLIGRESWNDRIEQSILDGLQTRCFPSGTPVHLPDNTTASIETLSVGDEVLAFTDRAAELVPARVVRLYENVTQEMIRLEFADGRDMLHVTPGHAFLDETGGFTKIGDLLKLGGGNARVIDADGSVMEVTGEWLQYSAETADLFEQASTRTMTTGGNLSLKEEALNGAAGRACV